MVSNRSGPSSSMGWLKSRSLPCRMTATISRSIRTISAVVICGPRTFGRSLAELACLHAALELLPYLAMGDLAHATVQGRLVEGAAVLHGLSLEQVIAGIGHGLLRLQRGVRDCSCWTFCVRSSASATTRSA